MTDRSALEEALRGHLAVLTIEIGDRPAAKPAKLARAADYIRAVFEGAGLLVSEHAYEYRGSRVSNVIARPSDTPGTSPFVVVGAHYDTVEGIPGADDNASGIAVLLELGRRIARNPPQVPVRLVAFTLEEPPVHFTSLQGSRVYLDEIERRGERPLGAIILEMVGYTSSEQRYPLFLRWAGYPPHGRFIGIIGNWGSRRFGQGVLAGFRRNPRLPVESLFVPFNGWILPDTRLSDHASFWDRGLPAVMVTDTAFFRNPNYHLPSDRMATLDTAFMAELVPSLEAALSELASLAASPY